MQSLAYSVDRQMASNPPLFVDLDGTLIHTDLLIESFIELLKRHPLEALKAPLWLLRGKAYLKERIARLASVDPEHLPYNIELLEFLKREHEQGRAIHLATASNVRYASLVAGHLGFFKSVLASDDVTNLSGLRKLEAIQRVAPEGFVYAGNDHVDVAIWNASDAVILVNAPLQIVRLIRADIKVEADFKRSNPGIWPLLKALRPHQWLKNMLVFLPLLPIATSVSAGMAGEAIMAFIAFSMCASSVYLINDLSDLAVDRAHPRKCKRPFASGNLSPFYGLLLVPLLLLGAVAVGALLPPRFLAVLGFYWLSTTAYTFLLKRYALIDVVTLAGLYTLRVIAGAAAISVPPSFWILAFSTFIFFSLALAKRYAELYVMQSLNRVAAKGRGYQVADLQSVLQMGVASGYMAVLVMALYINSSEIIMRYGHVQLLWAVCPLLMLWISRIWLKSARGEMSDDPLVFAVTDKLSRLIVVLAAAVVLVALAWQQ